MGCLRLVADYLMFDFLGFSGKEAESGVLTAHTLTPYFYGSALGIVLIGPLYDFFFAGAPYTIVMIINIANMLALVIVLALKKDEREIVPWTMFFYGSMT